MANDEMRQTWADGASGWVANEAIFDAVFAPVTARIIDTAELRPGSRVLDVGCGTGTLLARGADAGADVVGVDISPGMVEAARARVPAATVEVADAQEAPLATFGGTGTAPFDRVVSRFGVMFFADPTAAFANIRSASAAGARLVFACWRAEEENPMFSLGTSVLTARLAEGDPPPTGPGPAAFADRDRLVQLLSAAGWRDVSVDPLDFTCDYGIGDSDGVEERLATILGTSSGRRARAELEPALGAAGWAELLDEVRDELRRHLVDGAVRFPGAAWLAIATNHTDPTIED